MKAVLGINIDVRTLTEIDEISGKTDLMCVVKTQFDAELPESSCCYNCGGTKPVAAKQRFAPRSARNCDHPTMSGNARTTEGLYKGSGLNKVSPN